jgi:hypothetical protein
MTRSKALATVLGFFAICVFLLPRAIAGDWNPKTTMTASESVEVPGIALPVLLVRSYAVPILAIIPINPPIRPSRPKQRPARELILEQTYSLHFSPFLEMDILSRNSDYRLLWLWAAGGRPADSW